MTVLAPRRFLRLLASDAMNVSRDPMLILATVMSVLPAVLFGFTRQTMDETALAAFGIEQLSRYVAPIVLILPAVLVGWVTGFLLLVDRDDGVLTAVDATPIGKTGFLIYRATVTAIIGAIITAAALPIVVPSLALIEGLLLVFAVAAECVLAAAILPAVARNKVEGLALTKLTNIATLIPLLALLPSPWRYIFGIVPTYWLGELLGIGAAPIGLVAPALIVTHAVWVVILFRLLERRAG